MHWSLAKAKAKEATRLKKENDDLQVQLQKAGPFQAISGSMNRELCRLALLLLESSRTISPDIEEGSLSDMLRETCFPMHVGASVCSCVSF